MTFQIGTVTLQKQWAKDKPFVDEDTLALGVKTRTWLLPDIPGPAGAGSFLYRAFSNVKEPQAVRNIFRMLNGLKLPTEDSAAIVVDGAIPLMDMLDREMKHSVLPELVKLLCPEGTRVEPSPYVWRVHFKWEVVGLRFQVAEKAWTLKPAMTLLIEDA